MNPLMTKVHRRNKQNFRQNKHILKAWFTNEECSLSTPSPLFAQAMRACFSTEQVLHQIPRTSLSIQQRGGGENLDIHKLYDMEIMHLRRFSPIRESGYIKYLVSAHNRAQKKYRRQCEKERNNTGVNLMWTKKSVGGVRRGKNT